MNLVRCDECGAVEEATKILGDLESAWLSCNGLDFCGGDCLTKHWTYFLGFVLQRSKELGEATLTLRRKLDNATMKKMLK